MDAPASIREETTLRCPENMAQLFISTESCIYGVVCPIHNDSLKIPKIHIFLFQLWFLGKNDSRFYAAETIQENFRIENCSSLYDGDFFHILIR